MKFYIMNLMRFYFVSEAGAMSAEMAVSRV